MDSDNIVATKSDTDFVSMTSKAIFGINYKMVLLLFIIYILLHNDIFITRILAKSNNSVDMNNNPTTKGTIIMGLLLILSYILLDWLINYDLI